MRVLALGMAMHVLDSCIQGHHISKDFWMPLINKELMCAPHNPYAVAIKKGSVALIVLPACSRFRS